MCYSNYFGRVNAHRYVMLPFILRPIRPDIKLGAIIFYHMAAANPAGKYLFMMFIIFSRVGLYGFCIGYVQILQTGIQENARGKVCYFGSRKFNIVTREPGTR